MPNSSRDVGAAVIKSDDLGGPGQSSERFGCRNARTPESSDRERAGRDVRAHEWRDHSSIAVGSRERHALWVPSRVVTARHRTGQISGSP